MCFELAELNYVALKKLNFDVERVRTYVYSNGFGQPPDDFVTHIVLFVKVN
jgi:arylamine N-acetyltransferase